MQCKNIFQDFQPLFSFIFSKSSFSFYLLLNDDGIVMSLQSQDEVVKSKKTKGNGNDVIQNKRKWIVLPANSYINDNNNVRMGSRQYHQHYSGDPRHYWQLHQFGSPSYWWWSTWWELKTKLLQKEKHTKVLLNKRKFIVYVGDLFKKMVLVI